MPNIAAERHYPTQVPVEFTHLQDAAVKVRKKFETFELQRNGRVWSTEEIAMGMVVDLGDFIRLCMAKSGSREVEDVDSKLRHEFSDLLWSLFVLAEKYDIDLEQEFLKTMSDLELKLTKKIKAQQVAGGDGTR